MARDTTTGSKYENLVRVIIEKTCANNDLSLEGQVAVGRSPSGKHFVDWELVDNTDTSRRGLLSCKLQNTAGTAEEKIPFEVIKLLLAMSDDPRYRHAWIVIGGKAWRKIEQFYKEDLQLWIPEMAGKISIITTTELEEDTQVLVSKIRTP